MPKSFVPRYRGAEAAIRDFYDLDHAIRLVGIQPDNVDLIDLVRLKLTVAGNSAVDVSEARLDTLRGQVETHLRPVLRKAEIPAVRSGPRLQNRC